MAEPHFLVLTFPAQGHINPAIQFAKRLARAGAIVTFATPTFAHRCMQKTEDVERLTYTSFSDGFPEDSPKPTAELYDYIQKFNEIAPQSVSGLIRSLAQQGPPVTCVVYTILLPWAADVAREMGIASVLLWIQPAALLAIYYYYFHGYDEIIKSKLSDENAFVEFPGLPPFPTKDLPSFFQPTDNYAFIFDCLKEIYRVLEKESKPKVFVNTFEALEADVMRAVGELEQLGVGPLIPLAFLGGREMVDKSVGGDLHNCSRDYAEWLDSQPHSSVIYVSFGSFSVLPEHQMVEILNGLLASRHRFLWVIRNLEEQGQSDAEFWKNIRDAEAAKRGLVLPWCSQVEVLSHPSVGCFVTHCGWNSTLESLAVGVPMVGFPQWTDQPANIKLVESVWKVGVRAMVNEDGILEGGELRRCLDLVMGGGEEGGEMKRNAARWRDSAREAAGEGGSSDKNIRALVQETRQLAARESHECMGGPVIDC